MRNSQESTDFLQNILLKKTLGVKGRIVQKLSKQPINFTSKMRVKIYYTGFLEKKYRFN